MTFIHYNYSNINLTYFFIRYVSHILVHTLPPTFTLSHSHENDSTSSSTSHVHLTLTRVFTFSRSSLLLTRSEMQISSWGIIVSQTIQSHPVFFRPQSSRLNELIVTTPCFHVYFTLFNYQTLFVKMKLKTRILIL